MPVSSKVQKLFVSGVYFCLHQNLFLIIFRFVQNHFEPKSSQSQSSVMKSCSMTTSWVKKLCFVSSQSLYVQTSCSHLSLSGRDTGRQPPHSPVEHVKEAKLFWEQETLQAFKPFLLEVCFPCFTFRLLGFSQKAIAHLLLLPFLGISAATHRYSFQV